MMSKLEGCDIKKSFCSICSAGCAVDAYVKNGRIVHLEGSKPPVGKGYLCAKGYAGRGYVYREDRLKTPLKRIGKRGEGRFEPITWSQAYEEIAGKLNGYKKEFGPESVVFYTGFSKWYRPVYHRLAHSFGSLNYGTESSTCFQASVMASELNGGTLCRPDLANTDLAVYWGANPFHNGNYAGTDIESLKERGIKILLIDPRVTPFSQYADLQLRPRPGTDGALAHFIARHLIAGGRADEEYIERYVHGYPQYRDYVTAFDIDKTAEITGLSREELLAAANLFAACKRFALVPSQTALTHHINGVQAFRAVQALAAITGNFDREGGIIPVEYSNDNRNKPRVYKEELIQETRPQHARPKIGTDRFPLWSELIDECQAMDLPRNILEGTPYPIKAVFALGMNHRMFPGNGKLVEALEAVDFFVDVDLFLTDSAKYADIVLPACSSFERSELQERPGGFARYVEKAIDPLYDSKSDVDIICELAEALNLDDPLLRGGYEACCRYMTRMIGPTFRELRQSAAPLRIPGREPYVVGSNLETGLNTPTGKFELYSERIAQYTDRYPYAPLPEYTDPIPARDSAFPLILTAGGRLPYGFHSRFHDVPWVKALRDGPAAEIHPGDAKRQKIRQGDEIDLSTPKGTITLRANVTHTVPEGVVFLYHGYREADVNAILDEEKLDPYSGFPAYRSASCSIRKAAKQNPLQGKAGA